MPAKKLRPKRRRNQQGNGIFSDIAKGIKSGHDFVKRNKIISKAANLYASANLPGSEKARQVGNVASKLGYGKKRKMKGGCCGIAVQNPYAM